MQVPCQRLNHQPHPYSTCSSRPFSRDPLCRWQGAQRAECISVWTQRAHLVQLTQGQMVTPWTPSTPYGRCARLQCFCSRAPIWHKFPRKEHD